MSVRNHLIFQRGSELVLRSKAAKSLASQKAHHGVIYLSSGECYTECSPGLWTLSSVDLEKKLPRAFQAARTEKNSEQSKKEAATHGIGLESRPVSLTSGLRSALGWSPLTRCRHLVAGLRPHDTPSGCVSSSSWKISVLSVLVESF